jgi:hypothetical protein
MTTMALNAILVVEPLNGTTITPVQGNTFKPLKVQNNQITINIGSLFHGQARDFVFQVSNFVEGAPYLKATLQYQLPNVEKPFVLDFEGVIYNKDCVELSMNLFRLRFVEVIKKLVTQMKRGQENEARESVQQLINDISKSGLNDDFLTDLLKDIEVIQ